MNDLQKCDICGEYTTEGEIIKGKIHCENCIEYCPNCNRTVSTNDTLDNGTCTYCNEDY